MRGEELISNSSISAWAGDIKRHFKGICFDTRLLKRGELFFALKGRNVDGHRFLNEALRKNAAGLVVDISRFNKVLKAVPQERCFLLGVKDARYFLSWASRLFYKVDPNKFRIVAITGTNGKTTVSLILENILKMRPLGVVRIGTLGYRIGRTLKGEYTTPPSPELFSLLKRAQDKGIRHIVMEASSQGLEEGRLDALSIDVGIFTNLSQDHLDYHKNFRNYFNSKRKLFNLLKPQGRGVINLDSSYGRILLKELSKKSISFSLKDKRADIYIKEYKLANFSQEVKVKTPLGTLYFKTCLLGEYNLYNILGAVGGALSLNIPLRLIKEGIESLKGIPGRLQKVCYKGRCGFVDYAHTPQALESVLKTLRSLGFARIITVFGCGGERCKEKRPAMGRIAALLSDFVLSPTTIPAKKVLPASSKISSRESGPKTTG